jgi:hypothetical protein
VIARLDEIPELRRVRLESVVINAAQPHVALRGGEDGRLVRSGSSRTRGSRVGSAYPAFGQLALECRYEGVPPGPEALPGEPG